MKTESLEFVACRLVLGLALPEELPAAAVRALDDGCDSPSLRVLAGLAAIDMDEARPLFERALAELRVPKPGKRDAVMRLARKCSQEIVIGSMTPYDGAKKIWELSLRHPEENLTELDSFVYAASEWQNRPVDRDVLANGITAAARELGKP